MHHPYYLLSVDLSFPLSCNSNRELNHFVLDSGATDYLSYQAETKERSLWKEVNLGWWGHEGNKRRWCCKAGLSAVSIKQAVTLLLAEGATRKLQSSCSKTLSQSAQLLLQMSVSMLPVGLSTAGSVWLVLASEGTTSPEWFCCTAWDEFLYLESQDNSDMLQQWIFN